MANAAGAHIFQTQIWDLRVDNVTQCFQMGPSWKLLDAWSYLYLHITLPQPSPVTFPKHVFVDDLTDSKPDTSEQG